MDDECDKKFAEMQKYIPFLEVMIEKLQNVRETDSRYIQLQKMRSLHGILSGRTRNQNRWTIETMQRIEDVLQTKSAELANKLELSNKAEKGNPSSSQLSCKQNDDVILLSPSTSKAGPSKCRQEGQSQGVEKDKEIETPESPDTVRSSSPDCEILPIIIPAERSTELNRSKKQQYPSNTGTKVIPVITLTDTTISSPTESNSDDVTFSEWDMLKESERHSARNKENRQPPLVATSHDVATAAKLICNSLPQKVSDSRNYTLNSQDIPTVPVPSLGGSRRLSSVLEKNRLSLDIIVASFSRAESPVNVPEVRLNSPDPEILFANPKATSPSLKESHNTLKPSPKPPSIPFLFPSPPLSHKPPLSMEDLAELLNDEGNGKKSDKAEGNAAKQKQDADKVSKNFSLSEREKPFTARKSFSKTGVKSNEIKGPPHHSNDFLRSDRQTSFLGSKFQEPRYADNYERHPRQRDAHVHENAKDETITIIDEIPPQTGPVFHNAGNKSDERNVPLYQRRLSVPPDARIDVSLPRENEFMIDNSDYYSMHANQMHWTSPTATSDHQFGTNQWTSSSYGGMTNPPLQPTQHSFPRPSMESQFRQNQFLSNLPAGPRPLINPTVRPQEMSHTVRPENIREDMIPPSFPSQYRGFQMPQGSYDPAFSVSRSTEYPQVRPTWEGSASRMSEATYENVIPCGIQVVDNSTSVAFPRPNTPCPWGTRDRGNRRDNYYDRNRTEVRPSFNRDVRRSDWSRDGHSDRENPNRFSNRDPRVRTEHNAGASQAKETGAFARDPRLAKDKHVNVSTKARDTTHSERDLRKRSGAMNTKPTKEKTSSHKLSEKEKGDKLLKDRMQSPLESLYGVIDTKASQNSGLQKFKIPKIKRPEAPQPNRVVNETKKVESTSSKPPRVKNSSKKNSESCSKNKSKNIASAEVSSSSDNNHATENSVQQSNAAREGKISSSLKKSDQNETKISEADSVTNSKSNNVTKKDKDESETDGSKPKEEVTQELIEALIRKSFESGAGKKFVKQVKLIRKALKAKKLKKLKKIIESESESSSDKDETVEAKKKQTKKKRRVIVSDSSDDESLAERLGILTTNTDTDVEREPTAQDFIISTDSKNSEERLEITSSNNSSKELTKDITAKENDGSLEICDKECVQVDNNKNKDVQLKKKSHKANRLEGGNKHAVDQSESEKQINSSRLEDNDKEKKQTEDNQDKVDQTTIEKSKHSTQSNKECLNQNNTENSTESSDQNKNQTTQSVVYDTTNSQEVSNKDNPKLKTKRRNSLEILQEDIREMFINEGVTAAGFRMYRLSKKSQSPSRMSPITLSTKKDELSNTKKKITESNTESAASNAAKSRKSSRFRKNVKEFSKPKAKSKNDPKQTRSLRLKKSILNSDSEEDQPLALRIALLNNSNNSTPNQEVDRSEETNDTLRRSKRISRKDIVLHKDIKEPRLIVEKTDITKIDSSKVMFDSLSDESFGIDMSQLVDLSFRADKQSDQDSVDTMKRRKNTKNTGKRYSRSRNSLLIDKSEDEMSFTDEDSAMSDISMSSSATVRQGTSIGAARATAREELLSNILIGLEPTTENTSTDTSSEVDLENAHDPLAIKPSAIEKTLSKNKKKNSSWKMDIVYKKKKKNSASEASSKTAQTSIEETNTETNVSMDTVEADRLTEDKDKEPATEEKTLQKILGNYDDDDNANVNSILNDIKPLISTDSFNFKNLGNFDMLSEPTSTPTLNDSFSIEENKLLVNMEAAESLSSADFTATNVANKFFKESPKIVYDELFHRIDIKHLIDYAWFGQDKYKCLLCFFTGKNIVHHYKINHPGREVLISRLNSTDAQIAIVDAECGATLPSSTETGQMCKFRCRFCSFATEGAADVTLEAFYEHCTTHTGEYRFHCNNCSYQAVAKASMKTHYYKICRKDRTFNESTSEDIIPREGGIYGYLCCSCNYVQLKRQNVEAHVAFWHREQPDTNILKINMSDRLRVIVEQATDKKQSSHESTFVNAEEFFAVETKPQIGFEFEATECKEELLMDIAKPTESEDNDKNIQIKKEESEERPRLFQEGLEPMLDIKKEIKSEPTSLIPSPPDVVSITSVEHLLLNQQNVKNTEEEMLTLYKNASPTKNFVRLRRLSGDMLSMSTQDNPGDLKEFNTDGGQSDSAIDAEEECSLKIENVVSLAKPDHNESFIIHDIRKAMEISPTKSKEIPICYYGAIVPSYVQQQATHPGTTTIKHQCEEKPDLKRKLLESIEEGSLAKRLQF